VSGLILIWGAVFFYMSTKKLSTYRIGMCIGINTAGALLALQTAGAIQPLVTTLEAHSLPCTVLWGTEALMVGDLDGHLNGGNLFEGNSVCGQHNSSTCAAEPSVTCGWVAGDDRCELRMVINKGLGHSLNVRPSFDNRLERCQVSMFACVRLLIAVLPLRLLVCAYARRPSPRSPL
jgi:hypothetical protein